MTEITRTARNHFRGTVVNDRSEASRLGHRDSGLSVSAHSWGYGITVLASVDKDKRDIFQVVQTDVGKNQRELLRVQNGLAMVNVGNAILSLDRMIEICSSHVTRSAR